MSSLGNDSSGSRIAAKPKKALRPRLGDREADSEGSANSTLMTRFSRLRLAICSDSPATLETLDGYLVTSREMLCRRKPPGGTIEGNLIRLLWVPGHSGVVGNEKANRLASRGTNGGLGPLAGARAYRSATWKSS